MPFPSYIAVNGRGLLRFVSQISAEIKIRKISVACIRFISVLKLHELRTLMIRILRIADKHRLFLSAISALRNICVICVPKIDKTYVF